MSLSVFMLFVQLNSDSNIVQYDFNHHFVNLQSESYNTIKKAIEENSFSFQQFNPTIHPYYSMSSEYLTGDSRYMLFQRNISNGQLDSNYFVYNQEDINEEYARFHKLFEYLENNEVLNLNIVEPENLKKFLKALIDCVEKENFELCQMDIKGDYKRFDGNDRDIVKCLNDYINQINDTATNFEMLNNYFKIIKDVQRVLDVRFGIIDGMHRIHALYKTLKIDKNAENETSLNDYQLLFVKEGKDFNMNVKMMNFYNYYNISELGQVCRKYSTYLMNQNVKIVNCTFLDILRKLMIKSDEIMIKNGQEIFDYLITEAKQEKGKTKQSKQRLEKIKHFMIDIEEDVGYTLNSFLTRDLVIDQLQDDNKNKDYDGKKWFKYSNSKPNYNEMYDKFCQIPLLIAMYNEITELFYLTSTKGFDQELQHDILEFHKEVNNCTQFQFDEDLSVKLSDLKKSLGTYTTMPRFSINHLKIDATFSNNTVKYFGYKLGDINKCWKKLQNPVDKNLMVPMTATIGILITFMKMVRFNRKSVITLKSILDNQTEHQQHTQRQRLQPTISNTHISYKVVALITTISSNICYHLMGKMRKDGIRIKWQSSARNMFQQLLWSILISDLLHAYKLYGNNPDFSDDSICIGVIKTMMNITYDDDFEIDKNDTNNKNYYVECQNHKNEKLTFFEYLLLYYNKYVVEIFERDCTIEGILNRFIFNGKFDRDREEVLKNGLETDTLFRTCFNSCVDIEANFTNINPTEVSLWLFSTFISVVIKEKKLKDWGLTVRRKDLRHKKTKGKKQTTNTETLDDDDDASSKSIEKNSRKRKLIEENVKVQTRSSKKKRIDKNVDNDEHKKNKKYNTNDELDYNDEIESDNSDEEFDPNNKDDNDDDNDDNDNDNESNYNDDENVIEEQEDRDNKKQIILCKNEPKATRAIKLFKLLENEKNEDVRKKYLEEYDTIIEFLNCLENIKNQKMSKTQKNLLQRLEKFDKEHDFIEIIDDDDDFIKQTLSPKFITMKSLKYSEINSNNDEISTTLFIGDKNEQDNEIVDDNDNDNSDKEKKKK